MSAKGKHMNPRSKHVEVPAVPPHVEVVTHKEMAGQDAWETKIVVPGPEVAAATVEDVIATEPRLALAALEELKVKMREIYGEIPTDLILCMDKLEHRCR